MQFELGRAIDLLERTPTVLQSLLSDLPEEWVHGNEGPETWSPYDVLGHLIQGEQNDWIPRAKVIMEHGEGRAFEPFDRFAQFELSRGKTAAQLLEAFTDIRGKTIQSLRDMNLGPEDLKRTGTHPDFGRVTMEQLLATWVAHDLSHLTQISRAMARQLHEAVGPWKAYLSLLKDYPAGTEE